MPTEAPVNQPPPDTALQAVYRALDNGVPLVGTRLTVTLVAPVNAAPLTAVSISQQPRSGQNMSS